MSYYYRHMRRKHKRKTFEILALITGALLVLCAYAGKIDPLRFFPAPFLTLAFVPMLIVALGVLLIVALKRRWLAILLMIVALVAVLPVFKLFVPLNAPSMHPPVPADTTKMLKVMTYNVLAFNYHEPKLSSQPSATMRLILDTNPDVVLLQEGSVRGFDWSEVPSLIPYLDEMRSRYPYCYHGSEGLSIMSKYPFTTQPIGQPQHARSPLGFNRDQTGYLARAYDMRLPHGKQLRIIDFRLQSYHLSFGKNPNVRVSPDVKPAPLERMRRSFALRSDNATTLREAIDKSPANLIVCGDMNDVPGSHVYRVICGEDMIDAWATVGRGYASTYNRHGLRYRIDHMLYKGDLQALFAKRILGGSSDHYPLVVTFDVD